MSATEDFYDDLAAHYHLIFENWDASIENQGKVIASLLPSSISLGPILDCSCGIGTQLIALKQLGFDIEGSDLSNQEVTRALKEAKKRNLNINIRVDDMLTLQTAPLNHYGAILAMDNAIPHLSSDDQIIQAFTAMKERLKAEGVVMVSIRDYEHILYSKPKITEPVFFQDESGQRIIHQVWDWQDERSYTIHLYITQEEKQDWMVHHFVGHYRAVPPKEIQSLMEKAGLTNVSILSPSETGFYQPIIKGVKVD
ncbi:MAG: class I SAM-dependent methyltransferase [Proteobacteria bacterium]|nr:class I SAM-dependent methyltransferase [Pseudomonadota bacterium]